MKEKRAEFIEKWEPSYNSDWLHLFDARRRFESDLDALLKEVARGGYANGWLDSDERDIEQCFEDYWNRPNK